MPTRLNIATPPAVPPARRDAEQPPPLSVLLHSLLRCASPSNTQDADDDLHAALAHAAGCLQLWLGCDRVVLGLADASGKTCRVEVVSGQSRLDRRTESVKALERALDETLDGDGAIAWPARDEQSPVALTYRRVASALGCTGVVGAPLIDARGRRIGAVLALGAAEHFQQRAVADRLAAAAPPLAGHVFLLRKAHSGLVRRLASDAWTALKRRRVRVGAAAAAVLAAVLMIPVPYRLTCDCTIEPVVRRHVVAPFDGRLETTFVEPGDVVAQGDPLARMDEKELRWELTGLAAEHEQSKKRYDTALASRNAGASQVALLEMQQLEAKMRVLESRREQLAIQSPLDGVVIRGDLKRAEGAPLSVGQTLFEVAPLDEMVIEVAIPEHEVAYFQPGAEVVLRLDAFAGRSWTGRLDRIHPRAEIRDEANVFIAEVHIANSDDRLRPGMHGRAKITGPRRTIGWIWLHRPWEALRRRLHI